MPDPHGPFGAKGAREINVILPRPAICNAIYDAVGVRITSLRATPEKILFGLIKHNREEG
jgi:CO/xanthine dehydrogenase Mo-binding subunit